MAKRTTKMSEMTAIRFPAEQYEEIEAWRSMRRPLPPRGAAIRELVRLGLEFSKLKDAEKLKKDAEAAQRRIKTKSKP
jgi:hypothetical protein